MSEFGKAGNKAQEELNGAIGLVIEHVPTCQAILFRRIKIKSFSDKLDTKWKEEEVFGRMDPITTYQATSRTISFSFDIGDDTIENMHYALIGVSTLMNFQYPTYESAPNALTLSRPPLLRVRFANYITDGNGGPLLCAMKGMSYNPVDNFDIGKNPRVLGENLVPVRISVDMELRVLHESEQRIFLPKQPIKVFQSDEQKSQATQAQESMADRREQQERRTEDTAVVKEKVAALMDVHLDPMCPGVFSCD
jgi:hypothetical protein